MNAASDSKVIPITSTIEQMRNDGIEFFLSARLEPTVKIPDDAFQKEWPVDCQRVQDLLVSVHFEISNGGVLKSQEKDFLLALLREECRKGGRRLSEFEGVETDRDVIVQAIMLLMNQNDRYEGRTADLVRTLRQRQSEGAISFSEEIPVFTNIFSRRLTRLIPVLKGYGVDTVLEHRETGSHVFLQRLPTFAIEPVSGQLGTDGSSLQSSGQSSVVNRLRGSELQQADDSDGETRVDASDAKSKLCLPNVTKGVESVEQREEGTTAKTEDGEGGGK
jgi:hypothetical protein